MPTLKEILDKHKERTGDETTVYITSKELAERWRMAEGSLRNKRSKGEPPAYITAGKKVLYSLDEIVKHEEQNT